MVTTALAPKGLAQSPQPPPFSEIATIVVSELTGRQVALGALAAPLGRPIMLQFWASWCAPCLPESVHLASVRARYPEARLAMIGVNLDRDPEAPAVHAFRDRAGMTYTQAHGEAGLFLVATRETGLALPRCHLYRVNGELSDVFAGFSPDRSPALIDAAVNRALAI
jgi:thiol-disulfide isomerase/thioredoxin